MHSPDLTPRLKAQLLKAAVQDNADTIADRLPLSLRPARRLFARCLHLARVWMLPFSVIVGSMLLVAHWSLAAQQIVLPPPPVAASAVPGIAEPAPSLPDMSLLARPMSPGTLALGVRRIVLDAGHGGAHHGTESAGGLLEKELTLDLAERARRLLMDRGFEVVMTRTGDNTLSLKQRATTANQRRGDIFVSIHLNSLEPASARGIETFYLGPSEHPEHDAVAAAENQHSGYSLADMRSLLDGIYVDARRDESKRLAQAVQDALMRRVTKIDPQMSDRGVKTAPFVVLVATEMPAILAEVSCLSNRTEAERLGTPAHRQMLAEALVAGIQSFTNHNTQSVATRKETNER